jgi:HD-GYP domain-containing protein (c-di-GMP phosphodiesterase class II)
MAFPIPASRMRLGRDTSCEVKLDDPKVSRIHGWFEQHGGDLYYTDNGSTNGSLVNGQRIETVRLAAGDVIQVGASEFALLEEEDLQNINFVSTDSIVTKTMLADGVTTDALADKFAALLGNLRAEKPPTAEVEKVELAKHQRVLTSLQALQHATRRMSAILPVNEVLDVVGDGLFKVFAGAENLVILLHDRQKERHLPRLSRNREGDLVAGISISRTVLSKAVDERATIMASDVDRDTRFSTSDSLLGLSVKSVICAPLVTGDRVLGALYLDSRKQRVDYDELDAEVVTAFANQAAIALDNARLYDDLQESYHQMLQALVRAIEAKDPYTSGHTQRVKDIALCVARELSFSQKHLVRLGMAADLHDIGKIGIKEGIINKAGNLTDTEYSDIKMHVEMGEMILQPIAYLRDLLPWIRGHHEKWDGTGYPDRLKGEECPLEARVLAVADAFDAMTSKRPYNKPLTFEEGLGRVRESAGKHFDPHVVEAFERAAGAVRAVLGRNDEEAIASPDPSTRP